MGITASFFLLLACLHTHSLTLLPLDTSSNTTWAWHIPEVLFPPASELLTKATDDQVGDAWTVYERDLGAKQEYVRAGIPDAGRLQAHAEFVSRAGRCSQQQAILPTRLAVQTCLDT